MYGFIQNIEPQNGCCWLYCYCWNSVCTCCSMFFCRSASSFQFSSCSDFSSFMSLCMAYYWNSLTTLFLTIVFIFEEISLSKKFLSSIYSLSERRSSVSEASLSALLDFLTNFCKSPELKSSLEESLSFLEDFQSSLFFLVLSSLARVYLSFFIV